MEKHSSRLSTLGGTLIIAGTSIGAGMLGLPSLTGPAGFLPSLAVLFVCWLFMTITGLLYAELALHFRNDANLLTMARRTLGRRGKIVTWGVYLFFFYSLLVAYFVGGGNLVHDLMSESSVTASIVLFALILLPVIAVGHRLVDPLNKLCMAGLFAAYFGFVVVGASHVEISNLTYQNWGLASSALPIAFTAFGYQGSIPTLASWMHYDKKKLRFAIVCGTCLTLLVYILWQWLILGIVPVDGPNGLLDTVQAGRDAVHPLQFFTQNGVVYQIARLFAFFAIATSFLGVGIGLTDFWADGLKVRNKKWLMMTLAFLPPFIFALSYPHVFLSALGTAGGFGSALLLGALPVLMVIKAKGELFQGKWQWLKSNLLLTILLAFVLFEVICEIVNLSR